MLEFTSWRRGLHLSCREKTELSFRATASISILNHPPSVEVYYPLSSSISHSAIRRARTISFLCCLIISSSWKTWLQNKSLRVRDLPPGGSLSCSAHGRPPFLNVAVLNALKITLDIVFCKDLNCSPSAVKWKHWAYVYGLFNKASTGLGINAYAETELKWGTLGENGARGKGVWVMVLQRNRTKRR